MKKQQAGLDMKITVEQLLSLKKNEYVLIDTRNEYEIGYGKISGNEIVYDDNFELNNKPKPGMKYIFYCRKGNKSSEIAKKYKEKGYDSYYLDGGYGAYLSYRMKNADLDEINQKVELSLQKTYKSCIWSKFVKAIKEYKLINEGDKIAVCISGGKDSMLMAKLFSLLKRYTEIPFDVTYIVMDPGYSEENRKLIEHNAKALKIDVDIFESDIFDSVFNIEKSPCYLCARMRRGYLYNYAKEKGCNKIALGHHYDDVIETILMGMLYGAQIQTMMPKLHSTNFEGMELIRPMYLIREDDIKKWRDHNNLFFLQCACRFTDSLSSFENEESQSKRLEIKELIKELKEKNPDVENHIFRSVENVNLNTIIAYKKDGEEHHFLDDYE